MNWCLKKHIWVCILFTLVPYFVNSRECDDIRLDQAGSAFDSIPIYNQLDYRGIDANICYAIASSQLVDEYRFRKGDSLKKLSSPLSLAIGFKEYGGKMYSIEAISNDYSSSILGGGFIEETILDMNTLNDAALSNEIKIKLNQEFVRKHDKSKKIEKFHEKINLLLNQKIPVGIGYLMEVLQKKSGREQFVGHASVITGQRWNQISNTCELLVRDSYGSNCKDRHGDDRYALPCENGSVWVDAITLLGSTDKITWIPKELKKSNIRGSLQGLAQNH